MNPLIYTGQCSMKIIVATLVAFLLGAAFVSTEAEARCWWNGYNHRRYYHPRYYHHGWYYHGYYQRGNLTSAFFSDCSRLFSDQTSGSFT